jgi:periplasmic protein TonB
MPTRAFLLCGDEKAVHAVTQILDELEVCFEHSSEPPFALKRLATQRFDLLIVDCDNVQNATQVFNSARASNLNKTSIAIAIVEGKAGVPNAFRLGASLVLTKPVSLEQTRNTLRTGIGMTRKDAPEVKAPVAAIAVVTAPTPTLTPVPLTPAPVVSAPVIALPAVSEPIPVPVVLTPAVPPPAGPVSSVPVQVAPTPITPLTGPTPVATARPEITPKPAASIAPVSEKAAVNPRPTPVPAPPAQEYKPALTNFADTSPQPTVGAQAFAKAAAAASGAAPAGTSKFDSVFSSATLLQEETKSKTSSTKTDASEMAEPGGAVLRIEDPLAEENDALDPLRDHGVPSFGGMGKQPFAGLQKSKRRGGKGFLIAAVVLLLLGVGGYAAWMTQPAFRNLALWESGKATAQIADWRGQPQAGASVKPQPAPATPVLTSVAPPTASAANATTAASATPTGPTAESPMNPPSVSPAAADDNTQKTATVQAAKQHTTPTHTGASPALVPAAASLPPTTVAKTPSSDLLEVPEDYADDQVIRRVRPVYPMQARLKKLHGTVVLQAVISKQGKVDSLQLVSGDVSLAQAAADAVKQWRYKPYSHNGEPADFQTRITVDFKLP